MRHRKLAGWLFAVYLVTDSHWQPPLSADLSEALQRALGAAYSIERELGGGGMSRVFLAIETALSRRVVIKVLPPEAAFAVSADRFKREISFAANLQHPNILPLLTAGERDGLLYYTMPYVEGESLRAKLAGGGELPVAEAVRLLGEVTDALVHAHAEGVVHRDLKPENVLLSRGHAVVADFGVAKALAAASAVPGALTSGGVVLGTPAYMAPEQAAADPNVDHRADLYALGCLAFELLTGATPFANRPPRQMLAAHVSETPEPVEQRRPGVPPALAALVRQLLEKRPADRPQRAEEVLRSLDAIGSGSRFAVPVAGPHAVPEPGISPERGVGTASRRREARSAAYVVLGVAVLLAAIAVGFRVLRSRARSEAGASLAVPSIAVLPFTNLSDDRKNEYFSDGMTEELNTALSKVDGLRVVANASSFALKHTRLSATAIGETLHVAMLVEGSVRPAPNRVRISAQLVNATDGYQIWTDEYDRNLSDVFAVQDEIARAIVDALRHHLKLPPSSTSRLVRTATGDVTAHDDYLKGRSFWNQRTYASLQTAATFFEQAIARDSSYAQAYAGLADTYVVMPAFGPAEPNAAFTKAQWAAARALALDSTLAEAHNSLAYARMVGDYDWPGAEREFRRAIQLDPNYATAHSWYSDELLWLGRTTEAVAEKERACSLDPLSRVACLELARNLLYVGQYDVALQRLQSLLAMDPTFARTYVVLCRVYLAKGMFREAVDACEQGSKLSGRESFATGLLAHAYAVAGERVRAESVLRDLEERNRREYVSSLGLAVAHLGLGDTVGALTLLDSAVARHDPRALESIGEPIWAPLRTNPHLVRLRQRLKMRP